MIEERCQQGDKIRSTTIKSPATAEKRDHEFTLWSRYNYNLMKAILTTAEFADEYAGLPFSVSTGSREFEGALVRKLHRQRIDEKLLILKAIQQRLDMYPEPTEQPSTVFERNLRDENVVQVHQTPAGAFLSYTHVDDKHDQKELSKLRERLAGEVRTQTGQPFEIFQDRVAIRWGEQWRQRIEQALGDEVVFLIPIITPSFFTSEPCRAELRLFLERERRLGRHDLILPIYYVDCPVLNNKSKREGDELAQAVSERHYADWRELRFTQLNSSAARKKLAELAVQIRDAIEAVGGLVVHQGRIDR